MFFPTSRLVVRSGCPIRALRAHLPRKRVRKRKPCTLPSHLYQGEGLRLLLNSASHPGRVASGLEHVHSLIDGVRSHHG